MGMSKKQFQDYCNRTTDYPVVIHPDLFNRLVAAGYLDRHGNRTQKYRDYIKGTLTWGMSTVPIEKQSEKNLAKRKPNEPSNAQDRGDTRL